MSGLTLEGFFTIQFRDNDGNVTKEVKSTNMVLDAGINHLVTAPNNNYLFHTLVIGSNKTTFNGTLTDFGTVIASSTAGTNKTGDCVKESDKVYFWHRVSFTIPAGSARGEAARIGIKTSNNVLFSCASLMFDNNGVQTATTLDGSELFITYEYRVYHSTAVKTFTDVEILKGKMFTVKAQLGFDGTDTALGTGDYFGWGQSIAYPISIQAIPKRSNDTNILANKACQWNSGSMGTATTYAGVTVAGMQEAKVELLDRLTNGTTGVKGFKMLFDTTIPASAKSIGYLLMGTNYGVYKFEITPTLYRANSVLTYQFELSLSVRRA